MALEDDQIRDFASLAYLKGFLRIYATHLGLNADDMIRLYEKLYTPGGTPANVTPESGENAGSGRRRFSWRKLVLPVFLLLLLLATSYLLNHFLSPARRQPPPPPNGERAHPAAIVQPARSSVRHSAPAPRSEPEAAPVETKRPVVPVPEHAVEQKPAPDAVKGLFVRMKVTQAGTLAVTIDGAAAQNYDLAGGDVIEWKADRNIALELSNAGGVEVELNGKPLKPFGPPGNPGYVLLDANGVKQ